jgi:hypothetical protein
MLGCVAMSVALPYWTALGETQLWIFEPWLQQWSGASGTGRFSEVVP